MKTIPALGILIFLAACAHGGSMCAKHSNPQVVSPIPFARQLTGNELRVLLVGRTLSHDVKRASSERFSAILTTYEEQYRSDGSIGILLDRGGMGGRYQIIGDKLCLELQNGTKECRYFFESSDEMIVQQNIENGEVTPILVR